MYAVVGCTDCSALWVVEGRPDTTSCPNCGKRHKFAKLKRFFGSDDADAARQARASMLADRSGHGDAFGDLDSFAAMEGDVDGAGVDDETYLEGSGLDSEAVAAAGERATGTAASPDRRERVRAAVRDCEEPTEERVVAAAADRGVPESAARSLLAKMVRAGEASESGGVYRLL